MLLTDNDIKAELSYAYLHAVAARAGFGCEITGRISDGAGVDSLIRFKERLARDAVFTESVVEVQLKATIAPAILQTGRYSFFLRREHYDKLRVSDIGLRRFLVVLFLPENADDWLACPLDLPPPGTLLFESPPAISPFPRRVTELLMRSLEELAQAADLNRTDTLTDTTQHPGLSANFCEAISRWSLALLVLKLRFFGGGKQTPLTRRIIPTKSG